MLERLSFCQSTGTPYCKKRSADPTSRDRPNIRMVDKFGLGRVFIAGGKTIMYHSSSLINMQPSADAAQYADHIRFIQASSNITSQCSQSYWGPRSKHMCPRRCRYILVTHFPWLTVWH